MSMQIGYIFFPCFLLRLSKQNEMKCHFVGFGFIVGLKTSSTEAQVPNWYSLVVQHEKKCNYAKSNEM